MLDSILDLAKRFIPDKDKQKEFEAKMKTEYEKTFQKAIDADKAIQLASIKKGGINALWRPFGAIGTFSTLFFHWLIYPIIKVIIVAGNFNVYLPQLDKLPIEFYGVALAFISIYTHGRSMEKRL